MFESAIFSIRLNVLKSVASIISLGRLFQQSTALFAKVLRTLIFLNVKLVCNKNQLVSKSFGVDRIGVGRMLKFGMGRMLKILHTLCVTTLHIKGSVAKFLLTQIERLK